MEAEQLREAVERLHNCRASLRTLASVKEEFEGQPAWEGTVHVFDINSHPTADTCYAWHSAVEGSDKRRFYAVLNIPPVDSPEAAVRAAIVADHKAGRSA